MIGRYTDTGVYKELVSQKEFRLTIFAGLLALTSWLFDYNRVDQSIVGIALSIASIAINGLPIIWGAIKGLMSKKVNVDELVALAIIACLIEGEYLSAAVVSFVMVFGALIEEVTSQSARNAIKSLVAITPQKATVIRDDEEVTISVKKVRYGDLIIVRPGESIPVDAVIEKGITAIDQSSMTGEPLPVEKKTGDRVMAGTLNINGLITIKAEKIGQDTTLGKVIELVTKAERNKPSTVRLIDRYAVWFTPTILLAAVLTWVLTGEIHRAVAVLIVGCPCALILAAPTATVAAIGRAAKAGVLIKGGNYLEEAARAEAVLFDKTGTLTKGTPKVNGLTVDKGILPEDVLACAAGAEEKCNHPLARAILDAARESGVKIKKASEMYTEIGLGVRAEVDGETIEVTSVGKTERESLPKLLSDRVKEIENDAETPLMVKRDGVPIGIMSVSDEIRPGASDVIAKLKKLGIKLTGVLSGDNNGSVEKLGARLQLDEIHGKLKPEEKLVIINKLKERGLKIVYIGDGINDAPALAAADLGLAMGAGGTDVALETSDMALTRDNLDRIPFVIRLGRRMVFIIKANIAFGLLFNFASVIASGYGWLSPITAAVTHNIGSVLVVIASASIAFFPETEIGTN